MGFDKSLPSANPLIKNKGQQPVEDTTDKIIGAVERIGLPLVEVFMNATTAKTYRDWETDRKSVV